MAGLLIGLPIISGIFGRMSGSGMNKLWRRLGCSLIALVALWLLVGFQLSYWWVYLIICGLQFYTLSGYWDWLFGYDNMWFSGFMTGIALLPAIIIGMDWWIIIIRAIILAIIWGCLNVYLPQKGIWIWRRDIVEEFLRYATIPLLW
jgi:hypothetical protein